MDCHINNRKDLGASGSGACRWAMQRLGGVLIALLSIFALRTTLLICLGMSKNLEPGIIMHNLNVYEILAFGLFVCMCLHHSMLGVIVISEDYISCTILRTIVTFLVKSLAWLTIVLVISGIYRIIILNDMKTHFSIFCC